MTLNKEVLGSQYCGLWVPLPHNKILFAMYVEGSTPIYSMATLKPSLVFLHVGDRPVTKPNSPKRAFLAKKPSVRFSGPEWAK